MSIPKYAVPTGAIDGANQVFSVGEAYQPGSVAVFINGLLVRIGDEDGWSESNASIGEITLTSSPLTGDTVNVFYIDTAPPEGETVFENIFGTLKAKEDLIGTITEIEDLFGNISSC